MVWTIGSVGLDESTMADRMTSGDQSDRAAIVENASGLCDAISESPGLVPWNRVALIIVQDALRRHGETNQDGLVDGSATVQAMSHMCLDAMSAAGYTPQP